MAQTVLELGMGGQSNAEGELGWNRPTTRKGMSELKSGITCVDNYSARGRKSREITGCATHSQSSICDNY